jgi:hypothetical protein
LQAFSRNGRLLSPEDDKIARIQTNARGFIAVIAIGEGGDPVDPVSFGQMKKSNRVTMISEETIAEVMEVLGTRTLALTYISMVTGAPIIGHMALDDGIAYSTSYFDLPPMGDEVFDAQTRVLIRSYGVAMSRRLSWRTRARERGPPTFVVCSFEKRDMPDRGMTCSEYQRLYPNEVQVYTVTQEKDEIVSLLRAVEAFAARQFVPIEVIVLRAIGGYASPVEVVDALSAHYQLPSGPDHEPGPRPLLLPSARLLDVVQPLPIQFARTTSFLWQLEEAPCAVPCTAIGASPELLQSMGYLNIVYRFDPRIMLLRPATEEEIATYDFTWMRTPDHAGLKMVCRGLSHPYGDGELYMIANPEFFLGTGSIITIGHGGFGLLRDLTSMLKLRDAKADPSGHTIAALVAYPAHFLWYMQEVLYNLKSKESVYLAPSLVAPGGGEYHDFQAHQEAVSYMQAQIPALAGDQDYALVHCQVVLEFLRAHRGLFS